MLVKPRTLLLAVAGLCATAPAAPALSPAVPKQPPTVQFSTCRGEIMRATSYFMSVTARDPDGGGEPAIVWDTDADGAYDDNDPTGYGRDNDVRFDTAGPHPVRVLVTDDEGEQATAECVLTVPAHPPAAKFTVKRTYAFEHVTVGFDAGTSKDWDGTIVAYEWDFGGDGTYEERNTVPTTTWAFPRSGRHRVVLRVTSSTGQTGTVEQAVSVANLAAHMGPIKGVRVRTHGPKKRNPARASGRFTVDGDATRIDAFSLTGLPRMAAMDYRCEGAGCFKGTNPVAQLGRRARFEWPLIGWTMRAGDTIVLTVNCPGYHKRTIRITARPGRQPLIQ